MVAASVDFVPDLPAIAYFRSWQGTLGQSFGRLERETVWRQKQLAHKKTGALAASITSKRGGTAQGLSFDAGSWTIGYAMIHEVGSRPHLILPKQSPVLVFFWPVVGRTVFLKAVHHPGTKGYHYLTEGLAAAMRMWERGG